MENLNKKELKVWIKALRSGKYPQGKGCLQSKEGYCCLGVACKVLIPEDKQDLESDGNLSGGLPIDQPNSPQWLKNIGNRVVNGKFLSELNDKEGKTFLEIADLLENTYLTD